MCDRVESAEYDEDNGITRSNGATETHGVDEAAARSRHEVFVAA